MLMENKDDVGWLLGQVWLVCREKGDARGQSFLMDWVEV